MDGAMGSLLEQMFPELSESKSWMNKVLEQKIDCVENLHKEYMESGADIITTFTFRTNLVSTQDPDSTLNLAKLAVSAAHHTKRMHSNTIIFGSNGPAEDCYSKTRQITKEQLMKNHKLHVQALISNKVDYIIHETISHLDELVIVCNVTETHNFPYVLSIYFTNDLKLLSGESLSECFEILFEKHSFKPVIVAFNCVSLESMHQLIRSDEWNTLKGYLKYFQFGFSLNCGGCDYDSPIIEAVTPEKLSEFYSNILLGNHINRNDVAYLGSCCISNPKHTKSLSKLFRE